MSTILSRWGGMIWSPRKIIKEVSSKPHSWDHIILLGVYIFGAKLWSIAKVVIEALGFSGFAMLQGSLALVFVIAPWIITGLAVDMLLAKAPRAISRLCLVPLVLTAIVSHLLALRGINLPGPSYVCEILGGAWSIGLALWIRPVFAEKSLELVTKKTPGYWLATSYVLLALALSSAGADSYRIYRYGASIWPLSAGEQIPEFQVSMLEGPPLRSQDLIGRITLFVFWTSWCGVCAEEMPMLNELHQQFAEHNFQVIGINNDEPSFQRSIVERYLRERQLDFPIALDPGGLQTAFRVSAYPHLVLIDQSQQIRYNHRGRIAQQTLEQEIEKLFTYETGHENE